ncbi:MAG: DUF6075 family protein [Solobacterium sp.]|jgi:hypothetical protein|nr:DUF6075 family protein [Solobacterium sp.]
MEYNCYVSEDHKNNFYELLSRDRTEPSDGETIQLLYTIAGNPTLWSHHDQIYNCEEHHIFRDYKPAERYAASSRLLKRALHLYNSSHKDISTYDLCRSLDGSNTLIVLNAMRLYMGCGLEDYFTK